MHTRIMQVVIFFGVLSIPAFASAESGLFETPINKTTSTEEVTQEIAKTTTIQPVAKRVGSVIEKADKVTESVNNYQPLVEVNLINNPSIRANTGIVETGISKTPILKVNTSVAKLEVSEPLKVQIDTEVGQAEDSVEPTLDTVNEELMEEPAVESSNTIPESINLFETPVEKQIVLKETTVSMETRHIPLREKYDHDPLIVMPSFQSVPYQHANASSWSAVAVLESIGHEDSNGFFTYFGKGRMYFDQWLNAPPSQPPKESLFTISRI
ncbi:MAG: hypothetical protein ACE3JQ_02890 [Paenisporosarcina sp.]